MSCRVLDMISPLFQVFRVWTKNRSTSLDDTVSDKSEVGEDLAIVSL